MKTYKRFVCTAIGLLIVLFFGGMGDLIASIKSPFYENLIKPNINSAPLVICDFIVYCVMAVIMGESLRDTKRRRHIALWIALLTLELFCSTALYCLSNLSLCFIFHFLTVGVSATMLLFYVNDTGYLGFYMLPVVIRYVYLFMYNYIILLLNS